MTVVTPFPITRPARKQRPVPSVKREIASVKREITENSRSLQQSLQILAGNYSLDSFTIATSDGLVFASSGGDTAQEDAARYSRKTSRDSRNVPAGVALFSLSYNRSELTGIIRTRDSISGETKKHIKQDTEDILNRWI